MHNELPADWPQVTEGITIHWHGFDMRGAEYYDGVAFLQQCPIAPGTNFTYRFTVRQLLPEPRMGNAHPREPATHCAVVVVGPASCASCWFWFFTGG